MPNILHTSDNSINEILRGRRSVNRVFERPMNHPIANASEIQRNYTSRLLRTRSSFGTMLKSYLTRNDSVASGLRINGGAMRFWNALTSVFRFLLCAFYMSRYKPYQMVFQTLNQTQMIDEAASQIYEHWIRFLETNVSDTFIFPKKWLSTVFTGTDLIGLGLALRRMQNPCGDVSSLSRGILSSPRMFEYLRIIGVSRTSVYDIWTQLQAMRENPLIWLSLGITIPHFFPSGYLKKALVLAGLPMSLFGYLVSRPSTTGAQLNDNLQNYAKRLSRKRRLQELQQQELNLATQNQQRYQHLTANKLRKAKELEVQKRKKRSDATLKKHLYRRLGKPLVKRISTNANRRIDSSFDDPKGNRERFLERLETKKRESNMAKNLGIADLRNKTAYLKRQTEFIANLPIINPNSSSNVTGTSSAPTVASSNTREIFNDVRRYRSPIDTPPQGRPSVSTSDGNKIRIWIDARNNAMRTLRRSEQQTHGSRRV